MDYSRVPTLEDARAAAQIAVEAGATRVLLFGSLARDEARPGSDIDLVAVFDDLDYDQRGHIQLGLKQQMLEKVGHFSDVVVTDRPVWGQRIDGVPSCFEAVIDREAVALIDGPPLNGVNWSKPMVLPVTRLNEAASRVKDIDAHWARIERQAIIVDPGERVAWLEDVDYDTYLYKRELRFKDLCGVAHMTVEACLKMLLILYCDSPPKSLRLHHTGKLTKRLARCAPEQAVIIERLRGQIPHEEVSHWHMARNYDAASARHDYSATKERTAALLGLAERMTSYVLDEYERLGGGSDDANIVRITRRASVEVAKGVGSYGTGLDPAGFPGDHRPADWQIADLKSGHDELDVLADLEVKSEDETEVGS